MVAAGAAPNAGVAAAPNAEVAAAPNAGVAGAAPNAEVGAPNSDPVLGQWVVLSAAARNGVR